ncbi:MCF2L [Bugula neritina]|uniref:MCF2L n=1 Tax=Bugula neritina TaxID=10212 RepID=A0A7J7J1R0_BUGNE|nr:MCF2L [Bugula neritina]
MAAQAAPPPKDVTINEVASVLKSGFFFVTGSSSADGYPIIFSLDGVQPEPSEELQRNALIYIASLPTRPLKEIVLLQPAGFFQKRYSLSETGKLQNEFPDFQTIALDDTESLIQRYGAESICEQLGGSVISCVDSFIQQRMSIDSLETNCLDLEEREVKTNLSDEITNIKSQGEVVLQCFRAAENSLSANQQMLHIQEVQKLSNRLDDLENAITDYWDKEERKLQEFMKLREFHDEFKVVS